MGLRLSPRADTTRMLIGEILTAALVEQFGDRGLRVGAAPGPLAVFAAKHPEVGEVVISCQFIDVQVTIGDVLHDHFESFDTHLDVAERAKRLTGDVVRFLRELFADRLLFWQSADADKRGGWRERGDAGHTEPLVLDDRTYRVYLWSRPLGEWRASASILARGRIRDDREYQIIQMRLQAAGERDGDEANRARMTALLADYRDNDQ